MRQQIRQIFSVRIDFFRYKFVLCPRFAMVIKPLLFSFNKDKRLCMSFKGADNRAKSNECLISFFMSSKTRSSSLMATNRADLACTTTCNKKNGNYYDNNFLHTYIISQNNKTVKNKLERRNNPCSIKPAP